MKHNSKFLFVLFLGVFAAACELAVDFDRSKIPTAVADSSTITPIATPDASAPPSDAAKPDATPEVDAASVVDAPPPVDSATAPVDAATADAT